jgi:hypothetical protein
MHTTSYKHTTTEQTSQDSISSLPSLTRTNTSRKHPCYIANYLHSESTSSLFRQVHKTPDLLVIVQSLSLSPNFCNNDLTRTTRRSGESQAFGQDRPTTDLSPPHVHQNYAFLSSTDLSISSKPSS